jgi:hypothetical protein
MRPIKMVPDIKDPFWEIKRRTMSSITLIPVGSLIIFGTRTTRPIYVAIEAMTGLRVSESNMVTLYNYFY